MRKREPSGRGEGRRGADLADAGAEFRPVARVIPLTDQKPEGVTEDVAFRGSQRRYAHVRYGNEGSRRVAVVVDAAGPGDFDLYVDADRNGLVELKDRVAGTGRVRRALSVSRLRKDSPWFTSGASCNGGRASPARPLAWRRSAAWRERVHLPGKDVTARRVDGNANGLFGDADDRLWLDLNRDDTWDPIAEQFPCLPVLQVAGQHFGLRGDALGGRLTLEALTAEGRVRLQPAGLPKGTTIVHLEAMLAGEDGSVYCVQGADLPVAMPAGKYAVSTVVVAVQARGPGPAPVLRVLVPRRGPSAVARVDEGRDARPRSDRQTRLPRQRHGRRQAIPTRRGDHASAEAVHRRRAADQLLPRRGSPGAFTHGRSG